MFEFRYTIRFRLIIVVVVVVYLIVFDIPLKLS
jgi:hypothetical protein